MMEPGPQVELKPGPAPAGRPVRTGRRASPLRLLGPLLRFPLFYKILLANVAIVVVGEVLGARLAARSGASLVESTAALVAWALVGAAANVALLWLALEPLRGLERAAAHVGAGDLSARAPVSPLADRELARTIRAFNAMLDGLSSYRQRMRELAVRALAAAEEERKRLARELHDDTAQVLALLLVQLRLARAAQQPAERDALLDSLRTQLADAAERVRRYARGLRPPALDEVGLAAAIRAYGRGLGEAGGPAVDVEAEDIEGALTPEAELALYRIVQEALSNAAKHAGARHAWVRLRRSPAAVTAVVHDDGRGFAVDEMLAGASSGLGLFGMRERAAYVGGELDILSAPGEGTTVEAKIPRTKRAGS